MESSLARRLKVLLDNGHDEDIAAWVVNYQDDIMDALNAWASPSERAERLNPGRSDDLRLMVTGEDFTNDGEPDDE